MAIAMSDRDSSSSSGIGFVGMLTILFIGLKLTGYIKWSWWWVLSPMWISLLVIAVIVTTVIVITKVPPPPRRKP